MLSPELADGTDSLTVSVQARIHVQYHMLPLNHHHVCDHSHKLKDEACCRSAKLWHVAMWVLEPWPACMTSQLQCSNVLLPRSPENCTWLQ